ncbi:MAG TPA: hypothetical protein VLW85_02620 [Myxococcales bacterium]|nr:hypothetical protein [Myxococcales bacterium]
MKWPLFIGLIAFVALMVIAGPALFHVVGRERGGPGAGPGS